MFPIDEFAKKLPDKPGVYSMFDSHGVLLYVGKAKSLRSRVGSYANKKSLSNRIILLVAQISRIEITITKNEVDAFLLENNLIKTKKPKFNIVFRDDKSYPYIRISPLPSSRISLFRGTTRGDAEYFGPYPHATAAKSALRLIQKAFRLRTCDDVVFANRSRPCLLYQIDRCSAPCVNFIDSESYAQSVRWATSALRGKIGSLLRSMSGQMQKYSDNLDFEKAAVIRDQIRSLGSLQTTQHISDNDGANCDIIVSESHGTTNCIVFAMIRSGNHLGDVTVFPEFHDLEGSSGELCDSFLNQHYSTHQPPRLIITNTSVDPELSQIISNAWRQDVTIRNARSKIERAWVEMGEEKARASLNIHATTNEKIAMALEQLAKALSTSEIPERIECFDISHFQGDSTVASCVALINGKASPRHYRRLNITTNTPGDDFEAMTIAIRRRFSQRNKEKIEYPSILIVDGGAGQIRACMEVLGQLKITGVRVMGIAKGPGRILGRERCITIAGQTPVQLELGEAAFHLLLNLRDEAHRFALDSHRRRRSAARKESMLTSIDGVGPSRRRALIAKFGSIAGVRSASVDEIASLPGIGPIMAVRIKSSLE